jgi:hypothetical protein
MFRQMKVSRSRLIAMRKINWNIVQSEDFCSVLDSWCAHRYVCHFLILLMLSDLPIPLVNRHGFSNFADSGHPGRSLFVCVSVFVPIACGRAFGIGQRLIPSQ